MVIITLTVNLEWSYANGFRPWILFTDPSLGIISQLIANIHNYNHHNIPQVSWSLTVTLLLYTMSSQIPPFPFLWRINIYFNDIFIKHSHAVGHGDYHDLFIEDSNKTLLYDTWTCSHSPTLMPLLPRKTKLLFTESGLITLCLSICEYYSWHGTTHQF